MLLQKKMIDKEISNLKAIDTLIRQEQPFAVYRIPGEDTPRLLTQASGSVRLLYDLKDLDGHAVSSLHRSVQASRARLC